MTLITWTQEESFSNICSFVFFSFFKSHQNFRSEQDTAVCPGTDVGTKLPPHQNATEFPVQQACTSGNGLPTIFFITLSPPVLPVLADGAPPCRGSHQGLTWDLLPWDRLQTHHRAGERVLKERLSLLHPQSGVVHTFHLPHYLHKGE